MRELCSDSVHILMTLFCVFWGLKTKSNPNIFLAITNVVNKQERLTMQIQKETST